MSPIVDCHFTWGDAVRRVMLEHGLATSDRVHSVGCPRFDFYREPYLSLMGTRSEFLRSLGGDGGEGPVIVWATNTTYVSRNQRKILRRQVRQGKLPASEVRALLHDDLVQFREQSATVLELARRHPNWTIVVKVHPAEWINPSVALRAKAPNIHLAFNQPIFKFLYHCDVLLQRGCTTATEAWMLDKPVLELEIGNLMIAKRADFQAGNEIVTSTDEAETRILEHLAGRPIGQSQRESRNAFLAAHYGTIDGRASERCAALIDGILRAPAYTDDDQRRTASAVRAASDRWRENEDRRWINRAKRMLGIEEGPSLRFWRKLVGREPEANLGLFVPEIEITREMVDALHREYGRVLGEAVA